MYHKKQMFTTLSTGMPQGSILGPHLLEIHTNSLDPVLNQIQYLMLPTERLLGLQQLFKLSRTGWCSFWTSELLSGTSSGSAIPTNKAVWVQTVLTGGSMMVEPASRCCQSRVSLWGLIFSENTSSNTQTISHWVWTSEPVLSEVSEIIMSYMELAFDCL